ncbi:MAG: DUF2344 domain-containing protein [Eggerthellaceae bacterium]|nr:DUF2344 domain-containing protein [Eggerthellaceae bacterium]
MSEQITYRLRVVYAKTGRLAMLSHLELIRALERIVRRSNLPYAISCGFSPHMKISFGSALPVGVGGAKEEFDVFLLKRIDEAAAFEALSASAPGDIRIKAAFYVYKSLPAVSNAHEASVYEAVFDREINPNEFLIPETVYLEKKKETKERRVADYLIDPPSIEKNTVTFRLKNRQDGSLRPDAFVKACLDASRLDVEIRTITRIAYE